MPATTASAIVSEAFQALGIYAPGESIAANDADLALGRLNLMMGGLRLQPLTQPVQIREVFTLTTGVGVYTIGPGGDFDTTRPVKLSGAAILLNSQGTASSVTSLTRSGSVVTATMTSHGASSGQNVTIRGATQPAYNGTFPITVTGASTFTYLISSAPTSPATGTITGAFESTASNVVERACPLLTDDAWAGIQIKPLANTQYTNVYYNPTFAADRGTINLWPIPNTTTNSLVLYRLEPLTTFTSLTAQYTLPDGCEEALAYTLARRLITVYNSIDAATRDDVIALAAETMANFKRANVKLSDLATDPALTRSKRGGYNILSGTGGGD